MSSRSPAGRLLRLLSILALLCLGIGVVITLVLVLPYYIVLALSRRVT